jgi:hydrogenase/urease accessory protein HupE
MKKRLMLLWAPVLLVLALMAPTTAGAASYGTFDYISGYCSGDKVNATFKLVKYSGYYATKVTITAKGQEYYGGRWHTKTTKTFTKYVYTSGSAKFKKAMTYTPANSRYHRILAVGKAWNGGQLIAKGKDKSLTC